MSATAAIAAGNAVKNASPTTQALLGLAVLGVAGTVIYVATAPLRAASNAADAASDLFTGSDEDQQAAANLEKGTMKQAFDPNWYKTIGKHCNFTDQAAKQFAQQVYDSNGWFNDDEEQLYDVFRNCRSKAHVSKVARFFSMEHKKDLFQYIVSFTSTRERATIDGIMKNKPAKIRNC